MVDLSGEVARRLNQVGRLGRSVTLKVMTRHPDAPKEAPKVGLVDLPQFYFETKG